MTSIKKYIKKADAFNSPVMIMLAFLVLLLPVSSCKKLVETPPPSEFVSGGNVYLTDATAIAVLNGIYIAMNESGIGLPVQGINSIALLTGLSADEFTLYSGITNFTYLGYYQNALSVTLSTPISGSEHWSPLYNYVFKCNAAIEGLMASTSLTPAVKQQLLGEAKFLRAFFYFYLANLFGDLPLALGTDPEKNTLLSRSSKTQVYEQIVVDLEDAEEKLSDDFLKETLLGKTSERVRPTKWAAKALLARVYLYIGDNLKAEANATDVINQTALFGPLPTLNDVFLKNSREAIWQLQPTAINFNTTEAQTLIIPQTGPNIINNPAFLSDTLLHCFEAGDMRAMYGNWIDTTIYKLTTTLNDTVAYPNKYKLFMRDSTINSSTGIKNMKEYFMILRLAEQYLIRAEARAQLGNSLGAVADLNVIRLRVGLTAYSGLTTQASLLSAILHERQVELFSEWGHRWLDLKRTDKVNDMMKGITPLKANGASWQPYQQLYPLPLVSDLQRAPNLQQNAGY
jgi:starch-binding outer membrane protein, SusD/RagB family